MEMATYITKNKLNHNFKIEPRLLYVETARWDCVPHITPCFVSVQGGPGAEFPVLRLSVAKK
jgi:hypothetical protein